MHKLLTDGAFSSENAVAYRTFIHTFRSRLFIAVKIRPCSEWSIFCELRGNPSNGSFNVYCDMHTDGGGWTVFQRRQDDSVDFYRGLNDYKSGFGQLTAEFWLGNDKIFRLTAARTSTLRAELGDWNGVKEYVKYGKFKIADEQAKYRLELGSYALYSGTAGDSLRTGFNLNNMAFSTKDKDYDIYPYGNCAVQFTGAWWYKNCQYSNLNGKYLGNQKGTNGVRWATFGDNLSLKYAEMEMRSSG